MILPEEEASIQIIDEFETRNEILDKGKLITYIKDRIEQTLKKEVSRAKAEQIIKNLIAKDLVEIIKIPPTVIKLSNTSRSLLLDKGLIEKAKVNNLIRDSLKYWANEEIWTDKRKLVGKVILAALTVYQSLGYPLEADAQQRLDELSLHMSDLEDIIITSKFALFGKFYRDHLNHMVRVMLLSNVLAGHLSLTEQEINSVTLAGLLHDIAYPVAEGYNIFQLISSRLGKYFTTLEITQIKPYVSSLYHFVKWLPVLAGEDEALLDKYGYEAEKHYNHAVLGAVEFLRLWDWARLPPPEGGVSSDDRVRVLLQTARAISLHDSSLMTKVNFKKGRITWVLILSDELQDWGRPVGTSQKPLLGEIILNLSQIGKISSVFDYSKAKESSDFSPLRQIESKQKNLGCLSFDEDAPTLELTFKLPSYGYVQLHHTLPAHIALPTEFESLSGFGFAQHQGKETKENVYYHNDTPADMKSMPPEITGKSRVTNGLIWSYHVRSGKSGDLFLVSSNCIHI